KTTHLRLPIATFLSGLEQGLVVPSPARAHTPPVATQRGNPLRSRPTSFLRRLISSFHPILTRTSINKRSSVAIHLQWSFPKTAILLHHEARKKVIDALIVIHLRHETDILIRPQDNRTALFRINAVMLICVRMPLVVALIIDKDLPIIPAVALIPRPKDGR